MFKVEQCRSYKIVNEQGDFLHSDGTKLPRGEYWPTKEQAQAVLDKYRSIEKATSLALSYNMGTTLFQAKMEKMYNTQKLKEIKVMFEVRLGSKNLDTYFVSDGNRNYMHRDGEIIHDAVEYWPTEEQAQAVLDRHQPKHVWKHGDVFRRKTGTVMVYLVIYKVGPIVYLLDYSGPGRGTIDVCLADATFLFNIKDKL